MHADWDKINAGGVGTAIALSEPAHNAFRLNVAVSCAAMGAARMSYIKRATDRPSDRPHPQGENWRGMVRGRRESPLKPAPFLPSIRLFGDNPPTMVIGDRLRELREQKKFSQGDIEKRTGLLRCYISRVENGHTVPAIETVEKAGTCP